MNRKSGPALATVALLGLALSASCGPADIGDAGQIATVFDSAGIEIVSSPAPLWGSKPSWSISEIPDLSIGTATGDESYTLYGVRAAVRLPDGRIAIANQGLSQIKVYSASGEHLEDLGRRGEGPGEFMLLMDLWHAPGDSMVAADNRLARLTMFDGEGQVGRTIPLQQSDTPRQLFGRRTLDDGTLLVSGAVPGSEAPREGLFDGGTREFDRYSAEGRPMNHIGALPHGRNWGFDSGHPYGPSYTSAPFSIFSPPHASDGETVFLGDGIRAEVEQFRPDGQLLRIIRWGEEPRRVTPELQEQYRTRRMEGADTPERRQTVQQMLEGIAFPDFLPAYESLRTDSQGYLWIEPYMPDWKDGRFWWVFAPSGQWLGEISIPEGLDVLDIGSDYVMGVTRDEQGVERVVSYGLDRGPGS